MAPVSLAALMERASVRDRKAQYRAGMVCAALFNVNNNWERNPEGWRPDDFLPGAKLRAISSGKPSDEFVNWATEGIGEPDPEWEQGCLQSFTRFAEQLESLQRRTRNNIPWL